MEQYLKVSTNAESRNDSATAETYLTTQNSAGAFDVQRSTLEMHEMVYLQLSNVRCLESVSYDL